MSDVLTWVIGANGLLGSAVSRCLRRDADADADADAGAVPLPMPAPMPMPMS